MKSDVHVALEVKGDRDVVTMSRELEETGLDPVDAGSTMRRRKGKGESADKPKVGNRLARHTDVRNSFMAVPSSEVREAIKLFRLAVDQAIELANRNSKLQAEIDARCVS